MKRRLGILALTIAAWPVAAFAQSTDTDDGQVGVDGSVAPICILGDPSPAQVDLGQMAETAGARVGRIKTIADQSVTLADSFCNFAGSEVTVDATALLTTDATTPPAGFSRAVNFTATASGWAGTDSAATTAALADGTNPDASGTGSTQPLPKLADIQVDLTSFTVPGDNLMIAGDYSGTVVVTLGPAQQAP